MPTEPERTPASPILRFGVVFTACFIFFGWAAFRTRIRDTNGAPLVLLGVLGLSLLFAVAGAYSARRRPARDVVPGRSDPAE